MVGENVAPVIIKRKKVIVGGGHHGGAWKVAYADFVTAMMAFFMLMWLLNATTEQQRKGIADYFSPTIPLSPVSGGGDGAFGGNDIFSEMTLPKNGIGGSKENASKSDKAKGDSGPDDGKKDEEAFSTVEQALLGHSGESEAADETMRHIVTRVTDEGLVIEIFSLPGRPIFAESGTTPEPILRDIAGMLGRVTRLVENDVAVEGHVTSIPVVKEDKPVWALSAGRADVMRQLLEQSGLSPARLSRVTGHADREHVTPNPLDRRNDRLEVILLRSDL
ncbi:flagellar motor protein MotB [Poseidonocella sedimentorum]|uniref:Chemotaxis protein MotB n=1 Tax=Poseidonocella sedimentorum TaxID=871652 RepID=A0A1I6D5P1_9RHOB|nr:flagellar motor protein MotB [Poseidonocella sedimentorum]SFR00785.1 chemotaxis protein MotB [Poseidonocella sedimentorum]